MTKRFPKEVVKAAAKKVKGWASGDSEPHQVVPESGGGFVASELALMEDALHSAISRQEELRRWALSFGDEARAASHDVSRRDFEELLKKVQRVRRPHATAN